MLLNAHNTFFTDQIYFENIIMTDEHNTVENNYKSYFFNNKQNNLFINQIKLDFGNFKLLIKRFVEMTKLMHDNSFIGINFSSFQESSFSELKEVYTPVRFFSNRPCAFRSLLWKKKVLLNVHVS